MKSTGGKTQRLPRFLREYRGEVPGCPGGVGAYVSCVGSVFHARGAATEKAVWPLIRRRVRGMTRSPDDEARSADRAGTSATGVSTTDMCSALVAHYTPQHRSGRGARFFAHCRRAA